MSVERRLGRGLESLLGSAEPKPPATVEKESHELSIERIRPNPYQPRTAFDERELLELVESIRQVGILQPLVVRPVGEHFEIIAGERRFRAAQIAGLQAVPAVERAASDDDLLTLALVENLQRQDLNAIEKAHGFKRMIDRFSLTQEEAAKRIGKDRSTVANFIRLLDLPESVQHVVSRGTISMGHARALLGLPHASAQQALALRIEEEGLSVREVESIVSKVRQAKKPHRPSPESPQPAFIRDLENRMREHFGTKVSVIRKTEAGRITIHFFNDDDLQRILDVLGLSN